MVFGTRTFLGFMIAVFLIVWGSTNHYQLKSYLKLISASGKLRILFTSVLIIQLFAPSLLLLPEWFRFARADIVGVVIAFVGMALAVWAKLAMKRSWGVPGQHDVEIQPELITGGPFRHSRNPIYVGLFLFFVGFELTMGSWLIIAAIPVAVMIHRAVIKEEKRLEEIFGEHYRYYMTRTKRYI